MGIGILWCRYDVIYHGILSQSECHGEKTGVLRLKSFFVNGVHALNYLYLTISVLRKLHFLSLVTGQQRLFSLSEAGCAVSLRLVWGHHAILRMVMYWSSVDD